MSKSEAQLRHPLGLSNWQVRKLQRLSVKNLKEKNMAWIPKGSMHIRNKDQIQVHGAKETKKKRRARRELPSQRFPT